MKQLKCQGCEKKFDADLLYADQRCAPCRVRRLAQLHARAETLAEARRADVRRLEQWNQQAVMVLSVLVEVIESHQDHLTPPPALTTQPARELLGLGDMPILKGKAPSPRKSPAAAGATGLSRIDANRLALLLDDLKRPQGERESCKGCSVAKPQAFFDRLVQIFEANAPELLS
jgi:DNA-directed RNA polymerase subunit RPC12/RpoP